jgi:hypothetical protein
MSARSALLIVLLVAVVAIYGLFFAKWFNREPMQVMVSRRPGQASPSQPFLPPVDQVIFGFDAPYELKSVKVIRADELATNSAAYALWHLIGAPRSSPIRAIAYGQAIEGMKPYVDGAGPDPLEPNVQYVLQVQAKSAEVQTNFSTVVSTRRLR